MRLLQCYGSSQHIQVGTDKYRLKYVIAKGGFSTIYLARRSESTDKYAIKKIYAHSQLEVSRIRREIYAHQAFGDHAHLMKVLGVYRERYGDGGASVFFLVMEFFWKLARRTGKVSKTQTMLEESKICMYMRQLCEALSFMHNSQPSIAHRDVKPANLLLKTEDHVILTDFGSAVIVPVEIGSSKESQELKDEHSELCTMPYRAPELFNCDVGEVYDDRSAGCVLHALCFHRSPFDAVVERGDSIALATMSYKFKAPMKHEFSDSLLQILTEMLTVSTTDRPKCSQILEKLNTRNN
ncbi:Protein kinase domain-containing protein [Aphelenchoides bicaudatus]|nr:Protein kinase domain-containing protein [Aphelenchoides bicaudatus]